MRTRYGFRVGSAKLANAYFYAMGKLILIPTPIGNLEDITLRAIRLLGEADAVIAEDTRVSGKLLRHLELSKPLVSFHSQNEHRMTDRLVDRLRAGETMALISDAGTPGISDPGFLLVRAAVEAGLDIECLPGPTAFVPALVCSGLPCNRFVFDGFLPHKKGRQTRIKHLAEETSTVVLYESPHRLAKALGQLAEFFGEDRPACVARELTKMHESYVRGTLKELEAHYLSQPPKGECVIVIGGKP